MYMPKSFIKSPSALTDQILCVFEVQYQQHKKHRKTVFFKVILIAPAHIADYTISIFQSYTKRLTWILPNSNPVSNNFMNYIPIFYDNMKHTTTYVSNASKTNWTQVSDYNERLLLPTSKHIKQSKHLGWIFFKNIFTTTCRWPQMNSPILWCLVLKLFQLI